MTRPSALLCGVFLLAATVPAKADILALRLSENGAPGVNILDGDAADMDPMVDIIHWTGSIGSWTIDFTGQSTGVQLLKGFGTVSSSTAQFESFEIGLSRDGFLSSSMVSTSLSGSTVGTVTYSAFTDPSNILFGQSTALGGALVGSGAGFSATDGPFPVPTGPYSLTQKVVITHTGAGTTTFTDPDITAVPEPSSIALISTVALFALIQLKRRSSTVLPNLLR